MKLSVEKSNDITVNIDKLVEDINTNFLPIIPQVLPGYKVTAPLSWNHNVADPKFNTTLKADEAEKALILSKFPFFLVNHIPILSIYQSPLTYNGLGLIALLYTSDSCDSFESNVYPESLGFKISFTYVDPDQTKNKSIRKLSEPLIDILFDPDLSDDEITQYLKDIVSSVTAAVDPDLKFTHSVDYGFSYDVFFSNDTEKSKLNVSFDLDDLKYNIQLNCVSYNDYHSLHNISDIIKIFKSEVARYEKMKENLDKKYSALAEGLQEILDASPEYRTSDITELDESIQYQTSSDARHPGVLSRITPTTVEEITISPNTYNAISAECCLSFHQLREITIPSSIVKIGDRAFKGCENLKEVNLAEGIKTLREECFARCTNLKEISLPNSIKNLGQGVFHSCKSLEEVHLPDKLEEIPPYTFRKCINLKKIDLPASIDYIGVCAFEDCKELTSINIPDNVGYLPAFSFFGCTNLKEMTIGKGVIKSDDTFLDFDNVSDLIIHTDNEYITQLCIEKNIPCVSISEDLSDLDILDETYRADGYTIKKGILQRVYNRFEQFNVPDSVNEIDQFAFESCDKLKSVSMSDSVHLIDQNAFRECSSLQSIRLSDNIHIIYEDTFRYCSKLKDITLPKNLHSIYASAFEGCENLETIIIPDSVNSIGSFAFEGCSSLVKVHLSNKIEFLGTGAFTDCISLKYINLPASLHEISMYCFKQCRSLEIIELPERLEVIDHYLFDDCSNLKYVIVGPLVKKISDNAFERCDLNALTIITENSTVIDFCRKKGINFKAPIYDTSLIDDLDEFLENRQK